MSSEIERAFAASPRKNFLGDDLAGEAWIDTALPIGFGQTNSQPTVVRLMLKWLDVERGYRILDVGSGSGWTSALLSSLVGPKGHVFAVEKIPELVRFGRNNCQRIGIKNVEFFHAGTVLGLSKHAPYDRILVSASASELPEELTKQLKNGGKMVIPVGYDILEISKTESGSLDILKHPGFVFVPLV